MKVDLEELQTCEQAISNDPTNVNAYLNKGTCLVALGRYEDALAAIDQALHLDPSNVDAHYDKGSVLVALKRYEEALLAFDQAIHFDTTYESSAYNDKGVVLIDLKHYEEAVLAFDQAALLRDIGKEVAYQNKGYALYLLERYEEALVAYDKAIEIDPVDVGPYYGKIKTLRKLGRDDQVPAVFLQALRHDFHPLVKVRFLRDAGRDKEADSLEQAYKKKFPKEYERLR